MFRSIQPFNFSTFQLFNFSFNHHFPRSDAHGVETKAEITFSDLQNVKAHLASALTPGEYTLKVYTRSGLGDAFGVRVAARKITVA